MADAKISALTTASALAGTEVLPIVQSGSTKKVATDDLTVKNIRSNASTGLLQIAGPAVGTTRTMTVPDANFTAARTDAAQTFTGTQTFSGDVSVSLGGKYVKNNASNTDTTVFLSNSTGTGANFFQLVNGGGTYNFGIENSSSTYWGTPAYSFTVAIPSTRKFALFAGGVGTLFTADAVTQNVTVDMGNLVIGTADKGIDFSAATHATGMTSELLDDYEEGTFTPTWGADGGSPTTTYTINTGRYTKVGNVVTFAVYVLVNTTSGGSGSLRLYGLPFTSAADTMSYGAARAFVYNWVVNPKTYVVPAGTDSILIYSDDAANTIATPADLQASCYFVVSGSYRTAT